MRGPRLSSLLILFLSCGTANAFSYVMVPDHHLFDQAPLVVTGRVEARDGSHVAPNSGALYTVYDVLVEEVLKEGTPPSFLS